MFNSKYKQTKKCIDGLFNELQMNLSNNYKDLAIKAKKDIAEKLEELNASGDIKDKDYVLYKNKLNDYENRMVGYHH